MNSNEHEQLLSEINRSILGRALVISLAAHLLLIFGTSFSLYKDWSEYGIHKPSTIKLEKKKAEKEKAEAERREAAEKRASDAAAAAQAAPAADDAKQASGPAPAVQPGASAKPQDGQKEVKEPEIKPLPKKDFSLDDIGLD